jgi:hypothetical protein
MVKAHSKAYKLASTYYEKNVNKFSEGTFPPLAMSELESQAVSLNALKGATDKAIKQNLEFEDKKKRYLWKRKLVAVVSVSAFIVTVGVLIYRIVATIMESF